MPSHLQLVQQEQRDPEQFADEQKQFSKWYVVGCFLSFIGFVCVNYRKNRRLCGSYRFALYLMVSMSKIQALNPRPHWPVRWRSVEVVTCNRQDECS